MSQWRIQRQSRRKCPSPHLPRAPRKARAAILSPASGQFARGADIVFGAAGGTGLGVYRAAAEDDRLAIAVDLNLNHLHPGAILTSMVKRVDIAAYEAFRDAHEGRFATGVRVLGLAEGGVGWALDEHNAALITPAMKAAAEDAEAGIVAGRIAVRDDMADGRRPAWE